MRMSGASSEAERPTLLVWVERQVDEADRLMLSNLIKPPAK